jgi:hypothetical protein
LPTGGTGIVPNGFLAGAGGNWGGSKHR